MRDSRSVNTGFSTVFANNESPDYHLARIKKVLQGDWAAKDSAIKGNKANSKVTEEVIKEIGDTLLMLSIKPRRYSSSISRKQYGQTVVALSLKSLAKLQTKQKAVNETSEHLKALEQKKSNVGAGHLHIELSIPDKLLFAAESLLPIQHPSL